LCLTVGWFTQTRGVARVPLSARHRALCNPAAALDRVAGDTTDARAGY
jgi:hypothetical protein